MSNIKVVLSLTPEAVEILHQYAGERSRGRFVSGLLAAQRALDDAEGLRVAAEVASLQAVEAARKAQEASAAARLGSLSQKRASKRHGGHR